MTMEGSCIKRSDPRRAVFFPFVCRLNATLAIIPAGLLPLFWQNDVTVITDN